MRERWDLEPLFKGGSGSDSLRKHIKELEEKIKELKNKVDTIYFLHDVGDSIMVAELLKSISHINIHVTEATSFITCLLAQNQKDGKAAALQNEIGYIRAAFEAEVQKVKKVLRRIEETLWKNMLDTKSLYEYTFILNEWRKEGECQQSEKEEKLVSDLMIDGYHSWGQFYQALISDMNVHVRIHGETKKYSVGQAIKLRSHPDKEVRKESHEMLEKIWAEKEDLFARILNHIAGFRLQVYKNKKIENILTEPLINNRIEEETLKAMWKAVDKNKRSFMDYLNKKAELLGESKLNAYNFWAPISESKRHIEYKQAVNFVMEHLSGFGPELKSFILHAFEKGWVESENRPNKSPAAFCASFPLSGESRVFMTYGKTIQDVLTLAHELGHAFHNDAMKDVGGLSKQYPLSLAETASTFLEMMMLDAAIEGTTSTEEKLFLLDEKLKRSVMNFMNIHARFLFEKNFYEERKQGFVSASRLNSLMEAAIDEGYKGSLKNASAHSWIWTPHFYMTRSPFYNFPYTFGYLFSLSLYANAKEKGDGFEKDYLAMLRDSGRMSVEDLVMKHLGEDLTAESFWEKGLILCMKDVEEFIYLSERRDQ